MSKQTTTYVYHSGTDTYWSADDNWYLVHVPWHVVASDDDEVLEEYLEIAVMKAEAGNYETATYGPGLL